ncbi:DUF6407 family protein [Litchfieldia alkalitelluris]|uniref:DUF6407 family protein n=1 Tax=Litchfieldia alkalitelluris TaxID=304268 RepID=UPI001117360A|nr:DUF6407 family protein [Litchfieldia alkalitelluris]
MTKNLFDFLKETIGEIEDFNENNLESLREIVRKTIKFYQMKSFEETEETDKGKISFLHIHSMAEENLLTKIVEIALNSEKDIEFAYQGNIIRKY